MKGYQVFKLDYQVIKIADEQTISNLCPTLRPVSDKIHTSTHEAIEEIENLEKGTYTYLPIFEK